MRNLLPAHSDRLAARQAHGQWLRQQRQAQGWSISQMRRKLREAAKAKGDTLPDNECLAVMIHRWENGRSGISERYRLHVRHEAHCYIARRAGREWRRCLWI